MLTGVVIAESPRTDAQSDGRLVKIARVTRVAADYTTAGPNWI